MKKIHLILLMWVGCAIGIAAQNRIEGTVIAQDDNLPMIGVTVVEVGTTNAASTDLDGKYSLTVSPNASIRFTYLGFKPVTETVGSRSTINVVMEPDSHNLNEVVFMGYSGQKKAELSSSVISIDGDRLKDVTTSDVGTMLQGRIAGLQVSNPTGQPGDAAKLRIRGTGSFSASSTPLYVVDGIAGGSFSPDDIETITILKDAGATALYGSEGSNGVIVVTTKKAKFNQPTQINFKATYGFTQALKGKQKMMSGAELYEAHRQILTANIFERDRPEYLKDTSYDWYDAAFDYGNVQNYYISVGGASDKMNYMLSASHYGQEGTLINTNYKKTSARLNMGAKLSNTVDMNVRVNYERANKRQPSSYITLEGAYSNMPWDVPFDREGNLLKIDGSTRPDNGLTWYTQDTRNFLHSDMYNYARNKSSNLNADFQLNWNIFDWLTFTSNNRFSSSEYTYSRFLDPRAYDPAEQNGYFEQNVGKSHGWNTSNLLRANKTFSSIHTLNGLIGFETGRSQDSYMSANGRGMIPGKNSLNGTTAGAQQSYEYESIGWSVFGQVQYNLLDRYFLTGSLRADASSRFAKDKRVGYFPAISGAWLITNESFLPKNDVLSFLKLRLSYGTTGNSGIPRFMSIAAYDTSIKYQDEAGAVPNRLANSQLAWETARMTTFGLDFRFFNRIDLNVDLYNIDNTDLLLAKPMSPSTGFMDRLENVGDMRNKGLEIQISSDNLQTKDWYWNTTFNIAFNKNEVRNQDVPFERSTGDILQRIENGKDITSWYMPKWVGVDYENGDPVWETLERDAEGNIIGRGVTNSYAEASQEGNYQIVGRATPKFSGGFTNSVNYKGIGLDITTNFVYGNDIYNRTRTQYDTDGVYLGYNMLSLSSNSSWRRWEKPGDVATHPKLVQNGNKQSSATSSRYLEDGSFFRVKNITLYYDLPKGWLQKIKMNALRVYVSADNLFTITKFSGVDPEMDLDMSAYYLPGVYTYKYPNNKQLTFGVDIKF